MPVTLFKISPLRELRPRKGTGIIQVEVIKVKVKDYTPG
jgi:hypothetical protein